jgi:hypothetical protein
LWAVYRNLNPEERISHVVCLLQTGRIFRHRPQNALLQLQFL